MIKEQRGRGRPAIQDGTGRTSYLTIRISPIERKQIEKQAKKSKKSLTQWVRDLLLTDWL